MTVVEAVVERGRIRVAVPWAAKDLFKSIPGATWDETSKRDKRWHWPASTHTVEALGRTAKACGLELRGDAAYAELRAQAIDVYRARDAVNARELPDTPGATSAWLHQRQAHHFVKPMTGAILGMWMGEQPADALALTPAGWKTWDRIEVGDYLIGSDGRPTRIEEVKPWRDLERVEVVFADGARVPCSPHHLWTVRRTQGAWRTLPLSDVEASLSGTRSQRLDKVPRLTPVDHPDRELPLDPYVLGVLLGNGSLSRNLLRFRGDRHVAEVRRRGYTVTTSVAVKDAPYHNIVGLRPTALLKQLGLSGARSRTKHVPAAYLFASAEQRCELLRGLLDSDGSINAHHDAYFTRSPSLALDVSALVRSLGGSGSVRCSNGVDHRVSIGLPRERDVLRRVVAVEHTGRVEPMRCIRVANEDGLYVTNDYVLTHNTGKTRVAIGLLEEWEAQRVLIVCPSTVVGVWPDQFKQHAVRDWQVSDGGHFGRDGMKRWGSVEKRTEQFKETAKWCGALGRPFACVLNIESCWREPFYKWARSIEWDVVILDESHRAKAPGGRQSMAMHTIGKHATRRLALTGTPMPHSPLDVYAQARFVDEGVLGTSYAAFKKRYCDESIYDHSVTFKNLDQLAARLRTVMFQCGKEVLDLPPIIEEATHPGTDRSVVLSPRTSKAYQQMWTEMVADVGSGVVVAQNALSRVLRLQQMTSGYVGGVGDDDHVEYLGTEKRDAFADWLTDTRTSYDEEDDPVVVFARFRPDLDAIREVAAKQGLAYGEVSGRSKDGLTPERRLAPGVQVCGIQMQSGGVGIDLTAARFAVYYSIGHSLGDYLQSRDRVHRPGQARTTTYVHLVAKGTVDVAIRQALADKRDIIEAVLNAAKGDDNHA